MKVDKYSIDGSVSGQVELSDSVFNAEINDVLIYEMIKAANANLRQGTHSTKRRAQVRGGGAKPWRQKGTGRARAGTSSSPIWRGGGVVFGPHPRDHRVDLPKRIKKAALRSIFSVKMKDKAIKVVENISVEGKTREMFDIGKKLSVEKGLFITGSEDEKLKRSMKNLNWFNYNNVKRISSRELFYSKNIIISEDALEYINKVFAG